MKKITKKIILTIEAEFGSEFQKDSALDALAAMTLAWTQFYQSSHKKNHIQITQVEED